MPVLKPLQAAGDAANAARDIAGRVRPVIEPVFAPTRPPTPNVEPLTAPLADELTIEPPESFRPTRPPIEGPSAAHRRDGWLRPCHLARVGPGQPAEDSERVAGYLTTRDRVCDRAEVRAGQPADGTGVAPVHIDGRCALMSVSPALFIPSVPGPKQRCRSP